MRVVKMAAIARKVRTENALDLQRSSFRENPTYFLTSVEFSHNRQTDRQTHTTDIQSHTVTIQLIVSVEHVVQTV